MIRPASRVAAIQKSAIRRLYDLAPPGAINLGLGELDLPTPAVVRSAGISAIEEGRVGYTPNPGLMPLREAIAAYHAEATGRAFTAGGVCVTCGAAEAVYLAMLSLLDPGDEVLVPDPGYVAYETIAGLAGASVRRYPLPASANFALDRKAFAAAASPRSRLAIVLSPSNPTGQILSPEDLAYIAERMAETNALLLSDEIYRELYYDAPVASIAAMTDDVIVVGGLSKTMSMTGWRLGWVAGPEAIVERMTVLHQYVATCAPTIAQKAALPAFTPEGRGAAGEIRQELARRRDRLRAAVAREIGRPLLGGAGAFYAMLDVRDAGDSESVALRLLEEGVITIPGGAFGPHGEGYLRLSFSVDPEAIDEGVRRIARGLGRAPT
jgi:aspartate/methionine/tyrosine aminotransferase